MLAAPTIEPDYRPRPLTADFGGTGAQIHGIVYSGGRAQLNPIALDGGVIAFAIQSQAGARASYSFAFGDETPPSGFPLGAGAQVAIIRKSVVVCSSYGDDSGGPTACN